MENSINVNNSTMFYSISQCFQLSNMSKNSLCFIERCFPMVAESQSFVELDFIHVKELISSSGLNVDSELQVYNATDGWLFHKVTERSKYAKHILLKIRLSLLTVPALNFILGKMSSFTSNADCVGIIKDVLENKKEPHSNNPSNISRYCNQDKFNIIICGGSNHRGNYVNDVYSVEADNFNSVNRLAPMIEGRKHFQAVCIKNEVYVFGGTNVNSDCIMPIEKYSPATKSWEKVADMYDKRFKFCACSFMDTIYVIGGTRRSCLKFNIHDNSWKKVAYMKEERKDADCAVFEGNIVVCGGYDNPRVNTVEAYDHVADRWSYMPNMIEGRFYHKSVAVKNKLFVVGGIRSTSCEVYDSTCEKFVLLRQPPASFTKYLSIPGEFITIGSNLAVFRHGGNCLLYDFVNNEWSDKTCEVTKDISWYSCAKLPQF